MSINPSTQLRSVENKAFELPEGLVLGMAIPVAAALWRPRDRVCVVVNDRFARLTGRGDNSRSADALDDALVAPADLCAVSPGCCAASLRTSGGDVLAATLLVLPVSHHAERCLLLLFLDPVASGSRNAALVAAVDGVMREEMGWVGRAVMERLARGHAPLVCTAGIDDLTARERQVLRLVCQGCGDTEIAQQLQIARNTLRNHLANIYAKTGSRRRSDAVIWGRERGINTP